MVLFLKKSETLMEFTVFLIKEFKEELRRKLQHNFTRIYDTRAVKLWSPPPETARRREIKRRARHSGHV